MKASKYESMLRRFLVESIKYARHQAIAELEAEGHVASGKLIDIKISIDESEGKVSAYLVMEDYADKIDVGGFLTGDFRTMLRWAGFKHPEWTIARQAHLAKYTANKRSPSVGALAWSKNGRRTGWSKYALDNNMSTIEAKLQIDTVIDAVIDDFIKEQV